MAVIVSLCVSCSNQDLKKQVYSSDIGIPLNESPGRMNLSAIEQKIHRLTNEYRIQKGLSPLAQSTYLNASAREHSGYMRDQSDRSATRLVISHDRAKQRAPKIIADTGGVSLAENVGALHRVKEVHVAEKTFEGWIFSKGHLKNIVGDYDQLGVGVTQGKDYTIFATQIFVKKGQ